MTESIGEPLSTNLIERYLRARGRRYFRGHHDAEFFFVANAHLRLHVHLEISPAYRDVFTIRVSPAYFFPATDHTRLAEIVNAWNLQNHEVTAIVHGSSDPHRIGVAAERSLIRGPHPVRRFRHLRRQRRLGRDGALRSADGSRITSNRDAAVAARRRVSVSG